MDLRCHHRCHRLCYNTMHILHLKQETNIGKLKAQSKILQLPLHTYWFHVVLQSVVIQEHIIQKQNLRSEVRTTICRLFTRGVHRFYVFWSVFSRIAQNDRVFEDAENFLLCDWIVGPVGSCTRHDDRIDVNLDQRRNQRMKRSGTLT